MSQRIDYFFPFLYFKKTRLADLKDYIFHFCYEWLPAILILAYSYNGDLIVAGKLFLFGYLAFISIYEIGYLVNDHYSIRKEVNPRKRAGNYSPSILVILSFIVIRLAVFGYVTWHLGLLDSYLWFGFYLVLFTVFLLHNIISSRELKSLTFLQLAILRFLAPFFCFIDTSILLLFFPLIIVDYAFFRTLTYMDSKDVLNMPSRRSIIFKLYYYAITYFFVIIFALIQYSCLGLLFHTYFFMFWFAMYLAEKTGVVKPNS